MSIIGFEESPGDRSLTLRAPAETVQQAISGAGMQAVELIVTDWGTGEVPSPEDASLADASTVYTMGGLEPSIFSSAAEKALAAVNEVGAVASPNRSMPQPVEQPSRLGKMATKFRALL